MHVLPVAISDVPVSHAAQATCDSSPSAPSGMIHVELPKEHLRLTGHVDAEATRSILSDEREAPITVCFARFKTVTNERFPFSRLKSRSIWLRQ